ncbi:MAG TPA: DUF502 domain-containing protein [Phycisphaerae bacterium]|nr:DUF502 domain-containing protein [Phycisphaerae bacterium]
MTLMRSIKRSFWRGIAALLPALLTVVVIVLGLSFVHSYAGRHVNTAIQYGVHWVSGVPLGDVEGWYDRYWLGWMGVVVAIAGLAVAAYFVGTFLGVRLVRFFDGLLMRLPILNRIYPGAKQVSDFFFSEHKVEFRRVVVVQYPRMGLWSLGFVTGRSFDVLSRVIGRELLSVFVPTCPTPVTGFVITVPKDEVIDLPISIDEAFQYIISVGVIMPPAERLESLEVALLVKDGQDEARAAAEARRAPDAARPSPPGDAD